MLSSRPSLISALWSRMRQTRLLRTTVGDTDTQSHTLKPIIAELKESGIRSSIFLNPEPELIHSAAETGSDRIELYTESYAKTYGTDDEARVLGEYRTTALAAQEAGLGVNAGHDLNQRNLAEFLAISWNSGSFNRPRTYS